MYGRQKTLESLRPAQLAELEAIFNLFDSDGSGTIDPKEIRTQMRALGFEADNMTIYQLISDLDSDGSQKLELEEFLALVKDTLKLHRKEKNDRQHLNEVFDYLDDLDPGNRDKKIDSSNLKRIARILGDDITDAEIDVMIQGADKDGKGFIVAEDFYQLMSGQAEKNANTDWAHRNAVSENKSSSSKERSASKGSSGSPHRAST
ncbi:unnamed protein product [Polarella glacialis]|uniref:EF-hand domain-containing protein n=1 Tax=Polarella glacialis TaxID=89957 RepID=A0A813GLH7_POLGL|nr:unnamed protein product [Polarella glacialis]